MKIQAILAHPRSDSFCHALFERTASFLQRAGHDVVTRDLYAEGFDPVLRADESWTVGDTLEEALSRATDPVVRSHRREIADASGLVLVHPNWWGKPPAILAGWLDRVLVPGVAYRLESAEGEPAGLLSIRNALVLNTSDTPESRERTVLSDPLQLIWGNCVLPYCGVDRVERRMFGPVSGSDPGARRAWLDDAEALAADCFAPDA